MEILFFQRQSKFSGGKVQQRWARIIIDNDVDWYNLEVINEDVFQVTKDWNGNDFKIKNIPVMEQDSAEIVSADENDVIEAIEKVLVKEPTFKPEVIFSADCATFYKVVKASTPEEFEPKVIATKERNLLHYGICGEDNSVLIVAYSTLEDIICEI